MVNIKASLNRRTRVIVLTSLAAAIILAVFIAGLAIPQSSVEPDFTQVKLRPSWSHPFGTDWLGRDLFLRTLMGLSLSIRVGAVASLLSAVLATAIGIAAAAGSKTVDRFVNWTIDLVMGIPHLLLIILVSFACGRGEKGILIGVAVTHWTRLARLIRGEVLSIRSQHYIAASRKMGKSTPWILVHHILPHMVPQFIIGLVLLFPHAILHEAGISFLGYGLPPEQPAIGIILSESMKYLSTGMWWLAVFPGLTLVLIVMLFDRLGENLKSLIDPFSAHE